MRDKLGVYRVIADALQDRVAPDGHPFVRDVTISNSTFGNRYVQIDQPNHGVHALGVAELITAVEEQANLVYMLMNDQAYGVIKNIQDAQYDGRHHYSALKTPNFALICQSIDLPHRKVTHEGDFAAVLDAALANLGPMLIEVDMCAIGPFAESFAGPPAGAAGKSK